MDVVLQIGNYAAVAALVGLALLVPLYISQAHDLHRLRRWTALAPNRAEAERQAAEARAEADLAATAAERSLRRRHPAVDPPRTPIPVSPPAATRVRPPAPARPVTRSGITPAKPISPAERIALDRPATTRITAERPAAQMPVQERRAPGRLTPRRLAAIVGGVVALGIGVIAVAIEVSHQATAPEPSPGPAAVEPSEVEVAVLNGTAVPGLAAKVGDDVEANDFVLGTVTNSETPYERTVVAYAAGSQEAAQAVATALGAARVTEMDAGIRALAGGADVAVIAGDDRNAS